MNAEQIKECVEDIRNQLTAADCRSFDMPRSIGHLIIAIGGLTEIVEELVKRTETKAV